MTTFFMSATQKSQPPEEILNQELTHNNDDLVEQLQETQPDVEDFQLQEEDNKPFFQAITTLYGKIEKDEQLGYAIRIGNSLYRLFVFPSKYRGWLKQLEKGPDIPLYLRAYPKYQIIPRNPAEIYFQVVAWGEENQWTEPGIYIFRGIWQFVPQVKSPVISVYRNRQSTDYTEKFKATHLPVLMRREDEATPFRFNPKISKEDLPPRWFIQAKFKFIPSKNCWGWVEDIESPTQEIPRYKKPIKADPKAKNEFLERKSQEEVHRKPGKEKKSSQEGN